MGPRCGGAEQQQHEQAVLQQQQQHYKQQQCANLARFGLVDAQHAAQSLKVAGCVCFDMQMPLAQAECKAQHTWQVGRSTAPGRLPSQLPSLLGTSPAWERRSVATTVIQKHA
jgi:hypothetical protein